MNNIKRKEQLLNRIVELDEKINNLQRYGISENKINKLIRLKTHYQEELNKQQ